MRSSPAHLACASILLVASCSFDLSRSQREGGVPDRAHEAKADAPRDTLPDRSSAEELPTDRLVLADLAAEQRPADGAWRDKAIGDLKPQVDSCSSCNGPICGAKNSCNVTCTGENGTPCSGNPSETWRCVWSANKTAYVSQVCRPSDGGIPIWQTFRVSPVDCATCCGTGSAMPGCYEK